MSVFKIKLPNGVEFICNKYSGRWVISDNSLLNNELLNYLSHTSGNCLKNKINLLVLNTTNNCNMKCKYCLVGEKSSKSMSLEICIKVIENALCLNQEKVHIVFHGSEPLMNFNLIKKMVEYSKGLDHDNKITYSIQTNGTLIDDSILKFLKDNKVFISLSLDGLKKHQDFTRRYANGSSTYNKVISILKKIKKIQGVLSVNTVITNNNVFDLLDIVKDFTSKDIDYVKFSLMNPIGYGELNKDLMPKPNDILINLVKVFDYCLESLINNRKVIKVRDLSGILNNLFLGTFSDTCLPCGNGYNHPLIAIDINGDVYPCDYFFGTKKFLMGNINVESLNEILLKDNIRSIRSIKEVSDCCECNYQRFCGGGCLGDPASNFGLRKSYYCDLYKGLFDYVIKRIPLLYEYNLIKKILSWNW